LKILLNTKYSLPTIFGGFFLTFLYNSLYSAPLISYFSLLMSLATEIRTKYLEYYRKQNHAIVPSSPLLPENDPTTLFTGSGMQPMLAYLL